MPHKKRRKKRIKYGRILVLLVMIGLIIYGGSIIVNGIKNIKTVEYYLANTSPNVTLFSYNSDDDIIEEIDKLPRGTKVTSHNKNKTIKDLNYIEIKVDENKYYVLEDNLVQDKKDVVKEKDKYVRTSVTVYQNEKDSKIESFIKKGNIIEIIDYNSIDSSGKVNMYKIKKDDIEGWVYEKYLVDTEEEAKANYNENGVYDKHKNRKFSYELYGGKASTLDYYPFEKPSFEDNKLLEVAKTMYLNGSAEVIRNVDKYVSIATSSGVNAIVVDIKDGALAYPSEIAKEYSNTAYKSAQNSLETYKNAIDKIKEANIYVIGRIVAFNDYHYGVDHKDERIQNTEWVSAYSRGSWEYNVELAKEAIKTFGFNEIQYDYVRFPEASYQYSKNNYNFRNTYKEEKAEAIQNFLFYAADQIHKEGAYLSVDVFGECSGTYVTSYGQYWPAISNIVDVISSMPYTDHFGREVDTWTNAYQTVNNWAKGAAARQKEIPTPAIPRTWVTAYNTPFWNPTVTYGASKISDQAKALVDAGLKGGFITWNSRSSLSKYNEIKSAFAKDY